MKYIILLNGFLIKITQLLEWPTTIYQFIYRKKSLRYLTTSQNKHELQKTSFHFIKGKRISKNTVSQFG